MLFSRHLPKYEDKFWGANGIITAHLELRALTPVEERRYENAILELQAVNDLSLKPTTVSNTVLCLSSLKPCTGVIWCFPSRREEEQRKGGTVMTPIGYCALWERKTVYQS